MKKLYILDADVIIHLAELNKLDSLFKQFEIYFSPIVFKEIQYIVVDQKTGERERINLKNRYGNRVKIIETQGISEFIKMKKKALMLGKEFHEGEYEAIIFIQKHEDYRFCTGDAGAIQFLAFLGLSEQGISLEKLIGNIKGMQKNFTEKSFRGNIKHGKQLRIQYGNIGGINE
ncbi:type II toxin-antitoxin system VapC family toxin [bacterium]|nr:type II toxin-antitoxin system VapC family toxin [bacterium]